MSAHTKKYISISVLAHALLLLTFVMTFSTIIKPTIIPQQPFIESQLLTSIPMQKITRTIKSSKIEKIAPQKITEKIAAATTIKSAPVNELLALLHAAIQREQQYPASAQEQQKQGRVTLEFMLYPNGNISHLQIASTSGTTALDHAALAAVNAALPFQHIAQYLKSPATYRVDVVFELT